MDTKMTMLFQNLRKNVVANEHYSFDQTLNTVE